MLACHRAAVACPAILLLSLLALPQAASAAAPPAHFYDTDGDLLPPGARMRFGTQRFRQGGPVCSIAYSADGKKVASGGDNGTLLVWEARTGRPLQRFIGHEKKIQAVLFSHDGKTLFSASQDEATLRIWDVETGKQRHRITLKPGQAGLFGQLGLSRDGKTLVGTSRIDRSILRWEAGTGKELTRHEEKGQQVPLALSADGTAVATAPLLPQRDGVVKLLETHTAKELAQFAGHNGAVTAAGFSSDGKLLATAGYEPQTNTITVRIWRVDTRKEIGQRKVNGEAPPSFLAFLPDSKQIVWKAGGLVRLFEVPAFKEVRRFTVPLLYRQDNSALSPDGKRLAVATWQGAISEWDLATAKQSSLPPIETSVKEVLLSRDNKLLFVAGVDETIRIHDMTTGKEIRRLRGHRGVTFGVVGARDGKHIASGGVDGIIRVWEIATGKEIARFPDQRGGLDFTPDSKAVVTSDLQGVLSWWEVPSGKRRPNPAPSGGFAAALLHSPDSRTLAVSGYGDAETAFRLCDPQGTTRHVLGKAGEANLGLCFSPDSRMLSSVGNCSYNFTQLPDTDWEDYMVQPTNSSVRLWEVATGQMRTQMDAYTGKARSMVMSPDGCTLAIGTEDGEVVLWDRLTEQEWLRLRGHRGRVWSLDFSNDGKMLVSGANDGTALVWDLRGRRPPRVPPVRLTEKALADNWTDLGGEDGGKAYRAILTLARASGQGVGLLRGRLKPVPLVDKKRIDELIADLGADAFAVRQKAMQALEELGELAEPALRAIVAGKPELEVLRRAERILKGLDRPATAAQRSTMRALEVLELAGTKEAKALLRKLAAGADQARITRQAKEALRRLAYRLARE